MRDRRLLLTFGFLTGFSLVSGGVESTSAATITSSAAFGLFAPIRDPSASQTLALDLFDTTLGTLTGVRFLWHDTPPTEPTAFNGGMDVSAFTLVPDEDVVASAEVHATIRTSVLRGGLGEILLREANASADCLETPECDANAMFDDPFSEIFAVAAGSVPAFGASGGGTFEAELSLEASFSGDFAPEGEIAGGSAEWFGTLTVEYAFDPATLDVPTPATLVLLGIGIAALAAGRRRKA